MFWLLFVLILFANASPALAQGNIASFEFITEPQTIATGTSSAQITIEAKDSAGSPVKGNTVCLEFTSSSPTGDFSTNETWSEPFKTLILTLGSNQYRRNLFYKDTSSGTKTISARAALRPENKTCPGMSPEEWNFQWTATQDITISAESQQGSSAEQNTPETSISEPASPLSSSKTIVVPSIKAYAGGNRTAIAGSLVEFKGDALGLNGEPLESARFWWNFGDGNTAEGRAILHTFRIPGIYTVGLHVSSGQYAFSDYATVTVVPNQLQISGVIPGGDGYLRIANNGKTEIDFGGWIIEGAVGKMFTVPVKTMIASKAEIALLNSVTGLFLNGEGTATVKYPNGREALKWSASVLTPNNVQSTAPNTLEALVDSDVKYPILKGDPIAKEIEPERRELASAVSATQGSSWVFLTIALVLSVAASAGFLLFRVYGKT